MRDLIAETDPMKALVAAAIEEKRLIRFHYNGRPITAAPYGFRETEKQGEVFVAWQTSPEMAHGNNWGEFQLGKIYGLLVLDKIFEIPASALSSLN